MTFLVDTDRLIDAIAGVAAAKSLIAELSGEGLALSIITLGELFEGVYLTPDPVSHMESLRGFLDGYEILGLTERTMDIFARIRADLRRQGQLIPDLDILIAATAIELGLTLVTRNIRHFRRIPGLVLHRGG